MDKDFLLTTYGQCYGPEAGPWNLSVENKYLEYMFAKFFEENFPGQPNQDICNIGIGAGYWDRYLSYRLNGGTLTSIDKDALACRQLREGLRNEQNPNPVTVLHSDVMNVGMLSFDLVTMVGTTRMESGLYEAILKKALSMVKPGGSLYYQSLDREEGSIKFQHLCDECGFLIERYLLDDCYGFHAQYWKAVRQY